MLARRVCKHDLLDHGGNLVHRFKSTDECCIGLLGAIVEMTLEVFPMVRLQLSREPMRGSLAKGFAEMIAGTGLHTDDKHQSARK